METIKATEATEAGEVASEVAGEATELKKNLAYFTGTEAYHKFSILSNLVITDGVKYLADKAGAYWLLDIIASYQKQCMKDEMLRDFQIWTLTAKDNEGEVTCKKDSGYPPFIKQKIPYTDFPLDEIKLYCINNVILLTSEY